MRSDGNTRGKLSQDYDSNSFSTGDVAKQALPERLIKTQIVDLSSREKDFLRNCISAFRAKKEQFKDSLETIEDKLLNHRLFNQDERKILRQIISSVAREKIWDHVLDEIPTDFEFHPLPERAMEWDSKARQIFRYYSEEIEWNEDGIAEINLTQVARVLSISRKTVQRKTNRLFIAHGELEVISNRNGRGRGKLIKNHWVLNARKEKAKYIYARQMERKELFDNALSTGEKSWTTSEVYSILEFKSIQKKHSNKFRKSAGEKNQLKRTKLDKPNQAIFANRQTQDRVCSGIRRTFGKIANFWNNSLTKVIASRFKSSGVTLAQGVYFLEELPNIATRLIELFRDRRIAELLELVENHLPYRADAYRADDGTYFESELEKDMHNQKIEREISQAIERKKEESETPVSEKEVEELKERIKRREKLNKARERGESAIMSKEESKAYRKLKNGGETPKKPKKEYNNFVN